MRIKEKKKLQFRDATNDKQLIFALEMDVLTNRFQRLQLDNKIVTLLHELWDKMKIGGRRKVEVTTNEDGMEVIIGELMVPTFHFTNEKKFWRQLRCIISHRYKMNNGYKQRFINFLLASGRMNISLKMEHQ